MAMDRKEIMAEWAQRTDQVRERTKRFMAVAINGEEREEILAWERADLRTADAKAKYYFDYMDRQNKKE